MSKVIVTVFLSLLWRNVGLVACIEDNCENGQ